MAAAVVMSACATPRAARTDRLSASEQGEANASFVLAHEAKWEQLNPARGDASPQAATLWGDRNGTGPTGFLVKFVDGFSSPPHIHNVSYRGVAISGLVHNDDPSAEKTWMTPGSFWTQPKGGVHITAAKGGVTTAYIEIEEGPYLVRPVKDAFDSGEKPLNVDASKIAWSSASDMGIQIASLWSDPGDETRRGALVKVPTGVAATIRSAGSSLRAVVVSGRWIYQSGADAKTLDPGAYFSSTGESVHPVSCQGKSVCVVYLRVKGTFEIAPAGKAGA